MRFATPRAMLLVAPVLLFAMAGCSRHHALTTSPSALRGATPNEILPDDDPPGGGPPPPATPVLDANFAGRQVFSVGNPYAVPVDGEHGVQVDSKSDSIIQWMMNPDNGGPGVMDMWGGQGDPDWGMPYVGVSGSQPLVEVKIERAFGQPGYPGLPPYDSLIVHYPVPDAAKTTAGWIQGGVPGGSGQNKDDHLILVDWDRWRVYELWQVHWNSTYSKWTAGSTALWEMGTAYIHLPMWWTSAEGAGLPIFPGLVRYDEVMSPNPIPHGFIAYAYFPSPSGAVWPSTHFGCQSGWPAVGMRLRLKASVDIDAYPATARKIFQAMKTYGVIVADGCGIAANGIPGGFGIIGTNDPNWGPRSGQMMMDLDSSFRQLRVDDFEVVQMNYGAPPDWPCQP